jgi:hypothetical protein
MADVRNEERARRRWRWTGGGYEELFPRACAFTDIDAAVEFDGRSLLIEVKHHEGAGYLPAVPPGQLRWLRHEAGIPGRKVFVLYGEAEADSPWVLRRIARDLDGDQWRDWRSLPIEERRRRLKTAVNWALGLPLGDG